MDGVLGAAASSKSGGEIGGQLSQLPGPIAGALGAAWVGLVAAAPALLRCRLFGGNDRQQEMGCRPAPKCRLVTPPKASMGRSRGAQCGHACQIGASV
jgi:hypothetical protein